VGAGDGAFRQRLMRQLAVLAVALVLAACSRETLNRSESLNPSRNYEADSDLARTFDNAVVVVPRGGGREPLLGHMRDGTVQELLRQAGSRLPTILYLHGCDGISATRHLVRLAQAGFVVVAPNSFARRFRPLQCKPSAESGGDNVFVFDFRLAEISYAVHRMRSLPWVDFWRLFLIGDSEGGVAAALYRGEWFRARVITQWTCHGNYFIRGLAGRPDEPVLAIVRADDPWYRQHRTQNQAGDCGAFMAGRPRSRSLVLPGKGHSVYDAPETMATILDFLRREMAEVPAGH
jgi:dienelactone hydrolase